MTTPPPLPSAKKKDFRLAMALNTSIPGAGLFYLGQRKLGAILAISFMACFVTALALFLTGYARYLSLAMSEHLMEGDTIEQTGRALPGASLAVLAIIGACIYLCSTLLFRSAKRRWCA